MFRDTSISLDQRSDNKTQAVEPMGLARWRSRFVARACANHPNENRKNPFGNCSPFLSASILVYPSTMMLGLIMSSILIKHSPPFSSFHEINIYVGTISQMQYCRDNGQSIRVDTLIGRRKPKTNSSFEFMRLTYQKKIEFIAACIHIVWT